MKKFLPCLLALILCFGIAEAEGTGILGKPFADFSVTDCDGNLICSFDIVHCHTRACNLQDNS